MAGPRSAKALLCAVVMIAAVAQLAAGARPVAEKPAMELGRSRAGASSALPVVLWHGMGDSSAASYSMGAIKQLIEEKLGVFVYSIATGEGALADTWSSFFGNVNDQVAKVCEELRAVPELAQGYNGIGFSQGGQFLRAVVERCQHLGPRASKLITMGAQHQGVANIPGCSTVPSNLSAAMVGQGAQDAVTGRSACETMQALLGKGAYLPWVRDHVVQAQYFKDPTRLEQYLKYNIFLPDVNNERDAKNSQYADNLASLDQLVLYRFTNDTTVEPRDSSWFSELNAQLELVPLQDQPLYKEDWIGLRRLHEAGHLSLLDAPGQHMQFTLDWFEENVLWGYLAGDEGEAMAAAKQQ